MKTRDEHLQWCKDRALAYVDAGDLNNAVASMTSDLNKHPETAPNAFLMLLGMQYSAAGDVAGLRRWIEGFR